MAKRNEVSPGKGVKIEQVKIEKEGPHVVVTGAYTKRQLRRLLLSSISLTGDTRRSEGKVSIKITARKLDAEFLKDIKKDRGKPLGKVSPKSNEQVKHALEETGLSHADFELLRGGDLENITEEGKRILRDLQITEDVISEMQKSRKQDEYPFLEVMRELTKEKEKSFEELLREKGLSASLIKRLLENGLTEEYIRLLRALGFLDEDIEKLRKMWEKERKKRDFHEEIDSCASVPSSSDEYLSMDSIYLKNFLSKPLSNALREIVMKKPSDPIEYLGYWLLNFKLCEERRQRQKEYELELLIERERLKLMEGKESDHELKLKRDEMKGEDEGDYEFYTYDHV